ncbi:MAG: NYN domain-containing protein [Candidatus Paceibacterota bacterium]|jgi:uncharacterized LabA/DUF88 family protein
MNLEEFKKVSITESLGISEDFGTIYSFVDFGNVDFWFEKDTRDGDGNILDVDKKLTIGLEKLANFSKLFSKRSRFYFGMDTNNRKSVGFVDASRKYFDNTITKPVQLIKHYLDNDEYKSNLLDVNSDKRGDYINIPKCNFDVEICVDAIRLVGNYDTFCLFSGDADFINLIKFIKEKNKKVILIKSGFVQKNLANSADIIINAQDIKKYITIIKQKSSLS